MKQKLRQWAKKERKKLNLDIISQNLVLKLQETKEYKQAENIMFFYPLENEVNLLKILEDQTKKFYLPKISGRDLLCCPYSKGDKLCFSCFNTQEPVTKSISKNIIDLVIVPALLVDKKLYRLGYGGGFYDRFLCNLNVYKIVCIPKQFVVNTIYPEIFDVKIDKIITA